MILERAWKAKGLWLRILFCWALGSTFPFFDEVKQFDRRFSLRGNQEVSKQIVIVYLDQEDWNSWVGNDTNWLRTFKEINALNDSSFWGTQLWDQRLAGILKQDPRIVGVSFYFNPQLPRPEDTFKSLKDPRVVWAAQLDAEGRPVFPLMTNSYAHNVARGYDD